MIVYGILSTLDALCAFKEAFLADLLRLLVPKESEIILFFICNLSFLVITSVLLYEYTKSVSDYFIKKQVLKLIIRKCTQKINSYNILIFN